MSRVVSKSGSSDSLFMFKTPTTHFLWNFALTHSCGLLLLRPHFSRNLEWISQLQSFQTLSWQCPQHFQSMFMSFHVLVCFKSHLSLMDFLHRIGASRSQVTGGQNGSVLSSSEFYRPELDEWQAQFWQLC